MHLLSQTLKRLEGEGAAELRRALRGLDDAYMAIVDADELEGVELTPEDEAAQEMVAVELAAVNRRLDLLLALADVRDAARRVGRSACQVEAVEYESDEDAAN
jgi:hypothetical protein